MAVSRKSGWRRPGRIIAIGSVVGLVVAAGVLWMTAIRHSGDIADYADHLVADRSAPTATSLKVTSLGTTMMVVDDGITQILIDPFVTPVGLVDAAVGRDVSTDERAVDAALDRVGANRVKAIFVSHSHHDHAFDVAYVARRTGATTYGSESTLNIARGGNVPETQLRLLDPGTPIEVGGYTVRTVASKHSPDPEGGEGAVITKPLPQPAAISDYKEGGTFDFLIARDAYTMLFKGSANWIPGALDDVRADALFLGVGGLGKAGREFATGFLDATLGTVRPSIVIPTHWNDFFSPVGANLPLQRKLIDDTPTALDLVIDRARAEGVRLALLDAYSSVVLPRST